MIGVCSRPGSVRVLGDDLRLANDGSLQGRPKTSAVPCTTRALGRQRDLEIIHFPCRLESQFQEHTCRLEDARKEVKAVASFVRCNNIDQALRALKKKMQREGIFREMKRRRYYEKPSEQAVREKAEAVRRARKMARKQAVRDGLIAAPRKTKIATRPALDGRPDTARTGGPPRGQATR